MSHIHVAREEAIGTVTIDRPARFNSLDVDTARDLRAAALQLARDPAVRVMILRGIGGVFCSGADLKYIRAGGVERDLGYLTPGARPVPSGYGEVFKQILEYLHSTISEIRRAPKPVVAAVDGIAAAGGFGLAMSCDVVLASARSTFEWAYSRTGLTGAESSTFLLPRLIGLRRSLELMLLNPKMPASSAREIGLVTRVVPDALFDASVSEIARQLAAGPTRSYGIAKALMNRADGVDRLDAHLDAELEQLSRIADEPEFAAGLEAFFAKKEPVFGA
ncbi:MAG: enoyl-CoA hydratase/isomerase family protein [Acidobacteria bacterium]|nr:enoyl-CoA hydratase/isomerase family protein [Acidobacteriota bacterium]